MIADPPDNRSYEPITHSGKFISKTNHKSSYRNDLSCSFCNVPMEESQEHWEEKCTGCDFQRRNLKIHTMRERQTFWRRMKAKIEEKKKKKEGGG